MSSYTRRDGHMPYALILAAIHDSLAKDGLSPQARELLLGRLRCWERRREKAKETMAEVMRRAMRERQASGAIAAGRRRAHGA